ncbi:MAG: sigma-70 family RNA polymerase sigma factor [Bacteroidota bacterium]
MENDFQHIIDQHYGILYKIGRAYAQDQADFEDLYQEMLIQLWQSFPRFQGNSKLSTFIYRVALNTALTHQRKAKRRPNAVRLEDQAFHLADRAQDDMEADQRRRKQVDLLYDSINELKKEDRAIILLHLEGNSYEEMAEILGITINNIGVRLLRVKKRLQKRLMAKGYARV